jgi:hypothetical protein
VWVHPGGVDAARFGEVVQASGGAVSVHPAAAAGAQDRARSAGVDGAVDRAGHGWRQGCQDDLAAFARDAQDAVTVFLAEVRDVGAAGFEDPQPEQAEHRDEGEVVGVGGGASGGEHRFELQVGQSECGWLCRHVRAADVLGW